MFKRAVLAIATIAFMPTIALPADKTIIGGSNCQEWTKVHTNEGNLAYIAERSWLLGFVSAENLRSGKADYLKGRNYRDLFVWITNYCKDHPQADLAMAGSALVDYLGR